MLSLCALAAARPQFWSGKRVLIAGASSGLGAALATELSSRGALIALGARRIERLEAVASACAEVGAPSSIVELDVTAAPDVLADRAKVAAALSRAAATAIPAGSVIRTDSGSGSATGGGGGGARSGGGVAGVGVTGL